MLMIFLDLSFEDEEKEINAIIKRGKVIELRDKIQPWKLAKCTTNSLLLSLEVSGFYDETVWLVLFPLNFSSTKFRNFRKRSPDHETYICHAKIN